MHIRNRQTRPKVVCAWFHPAGSELVGRQSAAGNGCTPHQGHVRGRCRCAVPHMAAGGCLPSWMCRWPACARSRLDPCAGLDGRCWPHRCPCSRPTPVQATHQPYQHAVRCHKARVRLPGAAPLRTGAASATLTGPIQVRAWLTPPPHSQPQRPHVRDTTAVVDVPALCSAAPWCCTTPTMTFVSAMPAAGHPQ
jgi:hypothetical protein